MDRATEILDLASAMKARGAPFALATVVRTVAATAAKAGAKAVILPDGTITEGWIGGGCARAAVLKAAKEALTDGHVRLVSIQPGDLLAEQGVAPGEERAGISFAKNTCPSQGTMDIFVEPMLPQPEIVVCGSSPVAEALLGLGGRFGFAMTACAPGAELATLPGSERRIEGYALPAQVEGARYVVIATQSRGDEAALLAALAAEADYVGFVGSRRKVATLKAKALEKGADPARVAAVKGPAGLDLGAITPDEIALSILAEIVALRRRGQRREGRDDA
jgi:xanthine dehydrogenase accessory factor